MNKLMLIFILLILVACEGSSTYRGSWKATSIDSSKLIINFDAKKITLEDSNHKVTSFDYTQNSVSIENSISTYGIQVSDGRNYLIRFPISKNKKICFVMDENENLVYTLCKDSFMIYDAVYKLH